MATMTDDALLEDITEIFREILEDDALTLTPAFSRADNPRWDSMNHLNIIMQLEMKFGIKFSVVEIEAVQSVGDLMSVVRKKTG